MPTIILLDTSTLMDVRVIRRKLDTYSPLQFTISAIHTFLDEISVTSKLEVVAIVTCCSEPEVLCPFTREYDAIKKKLRQIEPGNEFNLYDGLDGIESLFLGEWPSNEPVTIVAVYDATSIEQLSRHKTGVELALTGKLLLLGLQDGYESDYREVTPNIKANNNLDVILLQPNLPITELSLQHVFSSIVESYYQQFVSQLICGDLVSKVTVWPVPEQHVSITDFDYKVYKPEQQVEIIGFLDLSTLGCPAAVSRHLISPWVPPPPPPMFRGLKEQRLVIDEDPEGNVPSFVVLLHGALKVENMCAICFIAEEWFGALYACADSKKKSNLVLALFYPGRNSVPWLGDLNALTIPSTPPASDCFPVKSSDKKSYSQNNVAWIRQPGLQSDIQKILRHARKLPEKTQQFYKELNRVRKAAICLGFTSLIEGLANLLERECTLLPGSAHPACAFQLTHAAGILREPYSRDPKYTIMPMKMSF
uniref:Integrator complex subunit 14 n=1 Tax=Triatoma dimidiata TaxID=72491 RepID=A0A0V0G936_TRIDM